MFKIARTTCPFVCIATLVTGILAFSPQAHAGTKKFEITFSGSGLTNVTQLVDSSPGGQSDTYKKEVSWKFTWPVTVSTLSNGSFISKVGKPKVKLTGNASAKVPHLAIDCYGTPTVPSPAALPNTVRMVGFHKGYLNLRFDVNPLYWAAIPSCISAEPVKNMIPSTPGTSALGKKIANHVFKLALNNPTVKRTFKVVYDFPPVVPQTVSNLSYTEQMSVTVH